MTNPKYFEPRLLTPTERERYETEHRYLESPIDTSILDNWSATQSLDSPRIGSQKPQSILSVCKVPDCRGIVWAKQKCRTHYGKAYREKRKELVMLLAGLHSPKSPSKQSSELTTPSTLGKLLKTPQNPSQSLPEASTSTTFTPEEMVKLIKLLLEATNS